MSKSSTLAQAFDIATADKNVTKALQNSRNNDFVVFTVDSDLGSLAQVKKSDEFKSLRDHMAGKGYSVEIKEGDDPMDYNVFVHLRKNKSASGVHAGMQCAAC